MRRAITLFAAAALLAALVVAPAGAASPSRGYLIGSIAPLTAVQVGQLRAAGATVKYVYENFGGAAAVIPDPKVEAVRALPFVTSVNEDTVKQPDAVRVAGSAQAPAANSSALPGTPYWLDLIDWENKGTFTGDGVWVAVLDTGFFPNWRDYFDPNRILTDKARAFIAAGGNENLNQWDVGSDPHGMATAATIVGYSFADDTNEGGWGTGYATGAAGTYSVPGVAPGAQVIPIKVCEPIGCFGSAINAAMDYVTSLKLDDPSQPIVINESLGGPGLDPVEKAAIDAATAAGVIIVASAGNSGNAGMGFPAAYEPVISVGAGGWKSQWNGYPDKTWWLDPVPEGASDDTEVDNEVFVVDFSSRQKSGQYLDVVSTGRFLLLPYPCAQLYKDGAVSNATLHKMCASKATPDNTSALFQYLFMSGTSFSAPTIAGVAALMLDKNGSLNNDDATFGTLGNPSSWGPGSFELLLEGSAESIEPSSVVVTHRTGVPDPECWETGATDCTLEATGYGWVFVDNALAAVPVP